MAEAEGVTTTLHHLRLQLDKAEAEVERLTAVLENIAKSWMIRKRSPEAAQMAREALPDSRRGARD